MKVAVLLSGCGVYDGSEIHESVFSLLALAEAGIKAICWFYLYFKSSLIFFFHHRLPSKNHRPLFKLYRPNSTCSKQIVD